METARGVRSIRVRGSRLRVRPDIRSISWRENDNTVTVRVAISGAWRLRFMANKDQRRRWIDRRVLNTRAWLKHNGVSDYTIGDDHITFADKEDAMVFFLAFR